DRAGPDLSTALVVDGEKARRGTGGTRSLPGARRGGGSPPRLGPPDARARAEAGRRAGGGRQARQTVGARASLLARRGGGRAPPRASGRARAGGRERELRSWLAGEGPARPGERLADALKAVAVEVEEQHGAAVEAVVVGDAPLDERRGGVVAAGGGAPT